MAKSENPGNVDQGAIKTGAQAATGDGSNQPADGLVQPTTAAPIPAAAPAVQQPAAAPPTEEEAEAQLEKEMEETYGKGFVRATNKDGQKSTFSKKAWELLGDNKEGWKKNVKKPQEVKDLEAGK